MSNRPTRTCERLLQAQQSTRSNQSRGALLFTCNGRGTRLFSCPDHDATCVQDELGDIPTAGFFAQGEIGPVGGQNFLHGFTASVALFECNHLMMRHRMLTTTEILTHDFYARPTLTVARELLGKYLVRRTRGGQQAAIIHEVEAYIGPHDLACQAGLVARREPK